jgi:hypothetical protein
MSSRFSSKPGKNHLDSRISKSWENLDEPTRRKIFKVANNRRGPSAARTFSSNAAELSSQSVLSQRRDFLLGENPTKCQKPRADLPGWPLVVDLLGRRCSLRTMSSSTGAPFTSTSIACYAVHVLLRVGFINHRRSTLISSLSAKRRPPRANRPRTQMLTGRDFPLIRPRQTVERASLRGR